MKINAIIESKDGGTLVLDFPRSIYDVYEKLQSVGIRQSPHQITLSDEEGDDVRVKLYSEDEIINYGGYAPHRGYIDWGFSGRTLLHTGKYIKYPKNSNCQRWIKRETSLRIRRCRDVPAKGNYYRRLFDYWWTLY